MTNVFFTADTHFGHARTLALSRRPYASVAEMDAALIDKWNAVVGDDDEVYHLGDVADIAHTDVGDCLTRLRGRLHLVLGNNDDRDKLAEYSELYKRLGSYPYDQDPLRPGWTPTIPNNRWADPNDARRPDNIPY